jgi:hypothetical protein
MFYYPTYKAIKDRLKTIAPVFYYIGQYQKGKDNTSYVVPAIYIEMPKSNDIQFLRRRALAKGVQIKIHYINYAPFKNQDTAAQDAALQAHETKLKEIDLLMNGWAVLDGNGRVLTEQLVPVTGNMLNFMPQSVVSVIGYKTDVYSYHLIS